MKREDTLTHGSLFSGIGGFELGAERAGIPTIWNCEIDEHKRKILRRCRNTHNNRIFVRGDKTV